MSKVDYMDDFGILEIDREGCIEPDNDPPQAMGDESIEVICIFVILSLKFSSYIIINTSFYIAPLKVIYAPALVKEDVVKGREE